MAIIEKDKCVIERLNANGLGVSKTVLGVLELPYTVPGELVEFERHSYRGQTNAITLGVLEKSQSRVKPPCKYFGSCGGCMLQHLNEETYRDFKHQIISKALKSGGIETKLNPVIFLPSGTRRRANLKCVKKDGQIFLGFCRFRSHQIINIDTCIALTPKLSRLIEPLKEAMKVVLRDKQKVQLFLNEVSNGIDIVVESEEDIISKIISEKHISYLTEFAIRHDLVRLKFLSKDKVEEVYLKETPYITFGGVNVETDAECFLQSSFDADRTLQNLVLKYIPNNSEAHIVDLFCGRGTYTLPLSHNFLVDGFESDKDAVSALKAASNLDIKLRDLYANPLSAKELSKYKYAVINPPRLGAEKQIKQLASSDMEKIVYVSCSPETFIRDAKILCKSGYKLEEITPVDQFYWNSHLELVALFDKTGIDL
ncbi:MAG: hypothetical protein V4485_02250 [Pseudomonadota bacterium]